MRIPRLKWAPVVYRDYTTDNRYDFIRVPMNRYYRGDSLGTWQQVRRLVSWLPLYMTVGEEFRDWTRNFIQR